MKNFIFISPNFPENYWRFCRHLRDNGFNVLGIGDCEYYNLLPQLKQSLTEYYKVSNLSNYEEVFRAVAFFTFRYGKIDWLESNNEYWLERDAHLRTEFNINTGFRDGDMKKVKLKSEMKRYYNMAGIKTARYCLVTSEEECKRFIAEVGYPVIVKPDNGVGASDTHRLCSDGDLEHFFNTKLPVSYIMEEYIDATVNSYDAIVNSRGEPIFETGNVTLGSLMDVVNTGDSSMFYIVNRPFDDVRDAGRRALKAFGVKSRFVHFEFFRLNRDQHIGKKGEVVALEVNMRPSGGISPDMMNYANSTDVYKIWADMVAFDGSQKGTGERFYCAFVGRRDGKPYVHGDDEIYGRYAENLKICQRVPHALSGAMGDRMFVANFKTKEGVDEFYKFATQCF
ncbi:MAG TPA: ATP-grasp domain-containing protein [Candidatus Coproplasma avicola]|uniref:ATP-grasp domain-containing protein n=1 Tax=Candidatus Coproplasma avicola TaxID=2840744 RepID=A0A9D1E5V1_9FIRM|nr:ATP-grasp domain-containing protein [Candidatus Coproplasma avicola]